MLIYLFVTLFLFQFSIFDIPLHNKWTFNIFLIISNLFAYWGFKFGAMRVTVQRKKPQTCVDISKFMNILFWSSLVIGVLKYMLATGDYSFSVWDKLMDLISGRITFLETYNEIMNLENVTGIWRLINYIVTLVSPFHWMYMPLSIYYWKKLSWWKKIGSAFILFLNSFQYISCGASVGFVHFAIFLLGTILLKKSAENKTWELKNKVKTLFKEKAVLFLLIILMAVVLISGFGMIMSSRSSVVEKDSVSIGNVTVPVNKDSLAWKIIPNTYENTAISMYSYMLKPYAAIDMALDIEDDVDIPLCFGMGGSWFLADNFKSITGYDVIQQTYNMRIQEQFGYDHYINWHTVYVWLANDFTFFGVPIVLFLLMMIFGMAWRSYLQTRNIFAFLMMILFVEFVFFMPMSNQVFQHANTLFAFWGILIYWLATRNKYHFVFKTEE